MHLMSAPMANNICRSTMGLPPTLHHYILVDTLLTWMILLISNFVVNAIYFSVGWDCIKTAYAWEVVASVKVRCHVVSCSNLRTTLGVLQRDFQSAHVVLGQNLAGMRVVKCPQVSCSLRCLTYTTSITQTQEKTGTTRLLIAVNCSQQSFTFSLL